MKGLWVIYGRFMEAILFFWLIYGGNRIYRGFMEEKSSPCVPFKD